MSKRLFAAFILVSSFALLANASLFAGAPLTFEERVKAQEAIERVYYNHRIWPKENPQPKPPFEQMVPRAVIEAKVTDYLKKCSALDKFWQRPIEPKQLQAEMDRMAKQSKDPEMLKELFAALGDDPQLIAECLVRPILAEQSLQFLYENYPLSEALIMPDSPLIGTDSDWADNESGSFEFEPQLPLGEWWAELSLSFEDSLLINAALLADELYLLPNAPEATCAEWQTMAISSSRMQHTAIWTGTEMIVWGGLNSSNAYLNTGGRYYPSTDSWIATSTGTNCPVARRYHSAVWTGTDMIIFGGMNSAGNLVETGGRYNPISNTWIATLSGTNPPIPRQTHTAVWTGTEMVIWSGGAGTYDSGEKYSPSSNSWVSVAYIPLTVRTWSSAVWTGTQMITWGGINGNMPLGTGGEYNPIPNTWSGFTPTGPSIRGGHTAVWTGSMMIVWGGYDQSTQLNTGGLYNPVANDWVATSIGNNVPWARAAHTAVWTGNEMIVWGGCDLYGEMNTGGRYSPSADLWIETSTGAGCPSARYWHTAIWTGSRMIIWGGKYGGDEIGTGGSYIPVTAPSAASSPSPTNGTSQCTITSLSWNADACAETFDVYVDGVMKCTDILVATCSTGSLADGLHTWYVVSKNASGNTTGPTWTFTNYSGSPVAASTPAPANGASMCGAPATLTWAASARAAAYDVYVDGSLKCADISGTSCNPGALADGSHTWTVTAKNVCGSTAGPTWTFTNYSGSPAAASTPAPANGASMCGAPATLTWAASARATAYDVYVDGSLKCADIAGTSCNLGALTDGSHTWTVMAKNVCGNTAGPTWTFLTESVLPEAALNPTPPDTSEICSLSPVLTWDAAPWARAYNVTLDGSPVAGCQGIPGTSCALGSLSNNVTHTWSVQAVNACGSAAGPTWSFTTNSGPIPMDLKDHLLGGKQSGVARYDWSAMGAPQPTTTHYKVYRSTSPSAPFPAGWTLIGTPTAQVFDDNVLGNLTPYFYDVRSSDACENICPKPINVFPSAPPSCDGSGTVTFSAFISGGLEPISYDWDFGDGSPHGTGASPSHTYAYPPYQHTVTLTVTDSTPLGGGTVGQSDTAIATASAGPGTLAAAPAQDGPKPKNVPVSFTANASGGVPGYTYRWSFGDGDSADVANPSHAYEASGSYTARVTVTDDIGCKVSDTVGVIVTE